MFFLDYRVAGFRCLKVISWQNYSIISLLKYPWYWDKFQRHFGKFLKGKVFVNTIGNGCNFRSSRVADSTLSFNKYNQLTVNSHISTLLCKYNGLVNSNPSHKSLLYVKMQIAVSLRNALCLQVRP